MSPQETNHHRLEMLDRHRERRQFTPVNEAKLESSQKIMYSVIFVIIIQMTQIKYSESTKPQQEQRMKQSTHSLYDADPIVFNTQSLYKSHERLKRSTPSSIQSQQFVDACQSRMEVLTPYYATNSKGKLRTIVNSELMQQAIQVETCASPSQSTTSTHSSASNRCNAQPECGCEQKYKWHRLLVLDATDEESSSKGLFMDWFLFPSNCVCRCKSGPNSTKHFLRTMIASKRHHQSA